MESRDEHDGDILEDEFEPEQTQYKQGSMTEWGLVGTRAAAVNWFRNTQVDKLLAAGTFPEWFHGIIRRV